MVCWHILKIVYYYITIPFGMAVRVMGEGKSSKGKDSGASAFPYHGNRDGWMHGANSTQITRDLEGQIRRLIPATRHNGLNFSE